MVKKGDIFYERHCVYINFASYGPHTVFVLLRKMASKKTIAVICSGLRAKNRAIRATKF